MNGEYNIEFNSLVELFKSFNMILAVEPMSWWMMMVLTCYSKSKRHWFMLLYLFLVISVEAGAVRCKQLWRSPLVFYHHLVAGCGPAPGRH